jgi:hypothetical protein
MNYNTGPTIWSRIGTSFGSLRTTLKNGSVSNAVNNSSVGHIIHGAADKMAGELPEGSKRSPVAAILVVVTATAILGTLDKLGKSVAATGEKAVINKGSKRLLRNVRNGAHAVGEKVYDISFSLKGKMKSAFGQTPQKKAAKAAEKAAAAQLKEDSKKAKTLATA